MPTVLLIEEESPQIRLLAHALKQEGRYEILSGRRMGEVADAITPDFIVFNTGMGLTEKQRWIESLRYLVPGVSIIDLHPKSRLDSSFDSGADAYVGPPYVETLLSVIDRLAAEKTAAQEATK